MLFRLFRFCALGRQLFSPGSRRRSTRGYRKKIIALRQEPREARTTMGHSFTNVNLHVIFSTKDRQPYLQKPIRGRVFQYLAGIVRGVGCESIALDGHVDHVHLVFRLHPSMNVAALVRNLKSHSTDWIRETVPGLSSFSWQEGYAAYSVSQSQLEAVVKYVRNQEEHHRFVTFQEEYDRFMQKHSECTETVSDDSRGS